MVLRTTGYQRFGQVTAPSMATDDMRHEMAHWLTADEDQRRRMNFGTPSTSADDIEERAASAERVLSAVVAAAARIVDMAISPRDKR
jgi:elongation factor P hydroxylase